jgi:hypothetical protein
MLTLSLRVAVVSCYPLPPSANREAVDGNILTDFSGWVGDALKILLVSGCPVYAACKLHVCVLAACVMCDGAAAAAPSVHCSCRTQLPHTRIMRLLHSD